MSLYSINELSIHGENTRDKKDTGEPTKVSHLNEGSPSSLQTQLLSKNTLPDMVFRLSNPNSSDASAASSTTSA